MRPVRAYHSETQKKSPIRVAFCILERAICGEDPNGTDISILMTKQPVQQVGIVLFISCHLQNDVA